MARLPDRPRRWTRSARGELLHRGTFNGNPISVGASVACISHLAKHAGTIYPHINGLAAYLAGHIRKIAAKHDVICAVNCTGSALQIALGTSEMTTLADTVNADFTATREFAGLLLARGIQIIGRGLMYMTTAHDTADIAQTAEALDGAFADLSCKR